ncbi:MAG: HAD-IA family hydrolase [Lachnospiraceae bacterium]|nr:HAD-IA family hydrolase [Lachnospiraceae bacterium]
MEAVIFDMDGLMFDTERVFVQAWDYAGEKIGIGKAGYMTLKTLGLNKKESEAVWKRDFGEAYDPEALRAYTKEFLSDYYANNKVPVKKGLYVLLEYLRQKGFRLAVASSSPRWEVERHLKDAGVFGYFGVVVCGDTVERSKPAPDIYLAACRKLGTAPEACYALEDSKNGLLSAHQAGCVALMVPDLWQPDEEVRLLAAGIFDDLEKVKQYLEGLEESKSR